MDIELETDSMRAWLSLANTVLVSIAMVLWYFAIWQEEKEEVDETKVVIIEDDNAIKCENKIKTENNSKTIEEDKEVVKSESQINLSRDNYNGDITPDNVTTNMNKTEEDTAPGQDETQEDKESQIRMKAEEKVSLGATFQWPRHQQTVEELRGCQDQATQQQQQLGQEVLDRLQALGIRRDSPTKYDSTVPLSDSARLSGKLLGRKVRITWDNFLAKSRPGLESETGSPKQNKNKRKKKSAKGGKKEESKSFVESLKNENVSNSSNLVCAA